MTDCEMKAVVAEAKTSVAPAIQPGSVSGRITRKKVRHFEAPSAREASTRFWSIWFMMVSSGNNISGISICVSAMTRPSSVCSRLSGVDVRPSPISVWLSTPSRARMTIQAKVRITTEVRSGIRMMKISRRCTRGLDARKTSASG